MDSPEGLPVSPEWPETPSEAHRADVQPEPVSQAELNAWRRGFTPQAEIWNGRLAMVGLSVGLTVLIVARLAHHG
ncbi:MAG: high light inducible protein [Cyanobacteriota bacterium]